MDAIASTDYWLERATRAIKIPVYFSIQTVCMSEKLIGVRDAMIVLSFQLSCRFVMLLRSWNY